MDDDQAELIGQPNELVGERATIEEKGVTRPAAQRGKLIHDAARHARRDVFGPLTREGKIDSRYLDSRYVEQGEREADLKGCAG